MQIPPNAGIQYVCVYVDVDVCTVYAAWNGTAIHQNIFLTSIQVVNAIILFIRRSHWINFCRMNPPIEQEVHSTGNIPKSNSSFRSPRCPTAPIRSLSLLHFFFCTPFSIILIHIGSLHGPHSSYHEMNRVNKSSQQHHTKAGKPKVSQSARFLFCVKRMKIKEILKQTNEYIEQWRKSIEKLTE